MALRFVLAAIAVAQCLIALASAQDCKAGGSSGGAAQSCEAILECKPNAKNGYYWLKSEKYGAVQKAQFFCDFTTTRCGVKGCGWTRVGYFNTADGDSCPAGLHLSSNPKPMCAREEDSPGCSTTKIRTFDIAYSRVCGRLQGYKYYTPDAFGYELRDIDKPYVDGFSLTHGNPRRHVWTWAADHIGLSRIPPVLHFIGNDYFMEGTGSASVNDELLWDGQGCESSGLCAKSGEPWFCRTLPMETTDDLELRACRNEWKNNEDVGAELLEIFVN